MLIEFLKDYFTIILFLIIAFVLSFGFIVVNYLFDLSNKDYDWSHKYITINDKIELDYVGRYESLSDDYNYIGFSPTATNLFDETLDIVEPPVGPDYWISVYFPHP